MTVFIVGQASLQAQTQAQSTPTPAATAPAADNRTPPFKKEELEQILAPVALYPDALLAQIFMASTYPLEIVQAERWAADPANAKLKGDALEAALQN
ncbi:MAG TPA: DUF3300 domain-containing protein, partial [Steroidobacteraceae bacterium]|nr:DUF3300 domain-containing protein [Steroidobacteraceae bacterium]